MALWHHQVTEIFYLSYNLMCLRPYTQCVYEYGSVFGNTYFRKMVEYGEIIEGMEYLDVQIFDNVVFQLLLII
jgi:hypothetical protein